MIDNNGMYLVQRLWNFYTVYEISQVGSYALKSVYA